eukprot:3356274-Amphidinium_carterae.1
MGIISTYKTLQAIADICSFNKRQHHRIIGNDVTVKRETKNKTLPAQLGGRESSEDQFMHKM